MSEEIQMPASWAAIDEPMDAKTAARLLNQSVGWIRDHSLGYARPKLDSLKVGRNRKFMKAHLLEVLREGAREAERQLARRSA